eukprot:TRINITY_DN19096_c0_g1_i1.p1 TRINITY_DN19096_c0_g1~~TRINITY_DN19096_c0_g1_i1.p1  ORF type:complete len:636 (+),score=107.37 TRINITY_DN19096_c0_g1_i1:163-2070(+)
MAHSNVRVVVIGDEQTGKTSLIIAAASSESFPDRAPPVLPPTRLNNFGPDGVPLIIVDTSSREEDKPKLEEECKNADAIVLTYACDIPQTLDRLAGYWLPELKRLKVVAPIVVVGCKLDLVPDNKRNLSQIMEPIMREYRNIETCIECAAIKQHQVLEVFYYAQKAVLHPTAPLFDQETGSLMPKCAHALKRIFNLCDQDKDGTLNDNELNTFQVHCFNAPLQAQELLGVKRLVQEKRMDGVNERGLTLTGFLFLNELFIQKGRLETTWTVLRKFGYDDTLKLRDDMLRSPSFKKYPDQSVEITEAGFSFLREAFTVADADHDGALSQTELEQVFSTSPESPWTQDAYLNAAEVNAAGRMTLNGFLSLWSLTALREPQVALAHFLYLGYSGDTNALFKITPRRRADRPRQTTNRQVLQCYVFGDTAAGKASLLDGLLGRPYSEGARTKEDRYAANIISNSTGMSKTLVMQAFSEKAADQIVAKQDGLAACDVAAFVFDSTKIESFRQAVTLLTKFADRGEATGNEVPCVFVAENYDQMEKDGQVIGEITAATMEMGLQSPIPVSMKSGDTGGVYLQILEVALRPHLSIPETQTTKEKNQYRRAVIRSATYASVGLAVAVGGIFAYRIYARRQSSA